MEIARNSTGQGIVPGLKWVNAHTPDTPKYAQPKVNKKVKAKEMEEQSNHQRTTRALRKSSLSKAKEKAKERAMAKAKSKAKAKVINQGILVLLNLLVFPKALRTLLTLHRMAKRKDPFVITT